ncbi:MAG: leucyl/phenylalanyl-tRNA--protein transferase family protein [Treponemataceae bacterium]|nr:leucyl/phenylalanyl-tRNA--protein transferase family protein [Treponemataceae bacterium]
MDIDDIFAMMIYDNAAKITHPEQLDDLRNILEDNFMENCYLFNEADPLEYAVKNTVYDEAVSDDFDESIIRRALELGYYPMSMKKRVTKIAELKENDFENLRNKGKKKEQKFFRNFMTIKYHANKLIIPFDKLHVSKKLKAWLNGKFADYTLTFNKAYDQCMEELLKAYPETWLTDDLLKSFKAIHETPDEKVSIDSVELWHDGKLVAGEIGFTTRNAYASLSGFHNADDVGTVLMCILGLFLKNNGYAYWDLGMELEYKYRFGAISCTRDEQEKHYETLGTEKLSFPKEEIKLSDFLKFL